MPQTTNFNLPYPEGSEIYNPLITEPVAMPIIDGQMRENQLAGLQEASHVKQGSNHAITLSVSGSTRFVFIASDDYVTGDTFTVDGQDVTVRIPSGEAPKSDCFKINSAVVCILDSGILTLETYNKQPIDSALNSASVNPVTNAAVTTAINQVQTLANGTADKVGSGSIKGANNLVDATNAKIGFFDTNSVFDAPLVPGSADGWIADRDCWVTFYALHATDENIGSIAISGKTIARVSGSNNIPCMFPLKEGQKLTISGNLTFAFCRTYSFM